MYLWNVVESTEWANLKIEEGDGGRQSDEVRKKTGEKLKGRTPWNKGKTGLQEAWNKGKEMVKTECPYCGKFVDIGNGKRWHFDKCKEKPIEEIK